MTSVWDLHDEIQDKIIEKNIFNYNAMTLKRIHETVDRVRLSADRHYIDSMETEEDIGAKFDDCKCSAKRRMGMKKRIIKYYEALLRGEIVDY
jgi:hypothetical protein